MVMVTHVLLGDDNPHQSVMLMMCGFVLFTSEKQQATYVVHESSDSATCEECVRLAQPQIIYHPALGYLALTQMDDLTVGWWSQDENNAMQCDGKFEAFWLKRRLNLSEESEIIPAVVKRNP